MEYLTCLLSFYTMTMIIIINRAVMHNTHLTITKQRQAILEALNSVVTHPTADDIHQMVRVTMPKMSLGTVYRNLEKMSECGMILKLNTAGVQKRFDGNSARHYHIRCCKCGKVEDVHMPLVDGLDDTAQALSGYKMIMHNIEFVGICSECPAENTQ